MALAPIGGVVGLGGPQLTGATQGTTAGAAGAKVDFAAGLENVAKAQATADQLGTQVATGQLKDIHEFMAASAKASLAVELTVAVRNKAVEAYQEIMRMQV